MVGFEFRFVLRCDCQTISLVISGTRHEKLVSIDRSSLSLLSFVVRSLFCFIQRICLFFILVNRCSCNKEGLQLSVYRVYLVAAFS